MIHDLQLNKFSSQKLTQRLKRVCHPWYNRKEQLPRLMLWNQFAILHTAHKRLISAPNDFYINIPPYIFGFPAIILKFFLELTVKMSLYLQLEPKKCSAWYVAAAKGDYQELAKLASKEPRLVKLKVRKLIFFLGLLLTIIHINMSRVYLSRHEKIYR